MTNNDPNAPGTMPMSQNINIVAIVSALLVVGIDFGLPITAQQKVDILVLVGLGAPALIAWLHTMVNHPANQVNAAVLVSKAVASVRKTGPVFLAFFMVALIGLSGCQAIGTLTPLQELQAVESGFALAEATYDAICSVNAPPGYCTDPGAQAAYAKSKIALEAAFQTAQAAIDASSGLNTDTIATLLAAVQADWTAYNQIVNTVQAKDAKRLGVAAHPIPL